MLAKAKRVYALADYTVECRANGWYYCRTGRFGEKSDVKGPYGSIVSITLMIARQLHKEIKKRDAPHQVQE